MDKENARQSSRLMTTAPANAPSKICDGKLAMKDESLVLTALSSVVGLRVGSVEGFEVG